MIGNLIPLDVGKTAKRMIATKCGFQPGPGPRPARIFVEMVRRKVQENPDVDMFEWCSVLQYEYDLLHSELLSQQTTAYIEMLVSRSGLRPEEQVAFAESLPLWAESIIMVNWYVMGVQPGLALRAAYTVRAAKYLLDNPDMAQAKALAVMLVNRDTGEVSQFFGGTEKNASEHRVRITGYFESSPIMH